MNRLKHKPAVHAFIVMQLSAVLILILGNNLTLASYGKVTLFVLFLSLVYDLVLFNQDHKRQQLLQRQKIQKMNINDSNGLYDQIHQVIKNTVNAISDSYELEIRYLEESIQRVRELHVESGGTCLQCTQAETGGDEQWIEWHSVKYPCPTIQALDGEK